MCWLIYNCIFNIYYKYSIATSKIKTFKQFVINYKLFQTTMSTIGKYVGIGVRSKLITRP